MRQRPPAALRRALVCGTALALVQGTAWALSVQPSHKDTTPPASAAQSPPAAAAPQTVESIAPTQAEGILGKKVSGPSGEDMGLVVDVLVDRHGRPRAAVIDFGGFLGVGSRKIAVDWRLLKFEPENSKTPIVLGLGRKALQSAPEYKPSAQTLQIIGPVPPDPHRGGQ